MSGFDYHRPSTLAEALRLREEIPGCRFIAGGTDLLVRIRKRPRGESPSALVSLRAIRELSGIRRDAGSFRIGALTTVAELSESEPIRRAFPALVEAALALGSVQVRNLATVGGNLVNASPAADLAPPLLVAGAEAEIAGAPGTRILPLEALFLAPGRTALASDEILTAVRLAPGAPGTRAVFLRRSRVRMDLAVASLALAARRSGGLLSEVRIAAGAVAPVPLRLRRAEAELEGRSPTAEALGRAVAAARSEISPITDLRSTRDHREALVGVLLARAVARVSEGGDASG